MKTPSIANGFNRRIYPADTTVPFSLELLPDIADDDSVQVSYIRDDWRKDDLTCTDLGRGEASFWQFVEATRQDRRLVFAVTFRGEHQHTLRLTCKGRQQLEYFYSLEGEAARLCAYKASIHCHSAVTGGTLTPMQCAAAMRAAGFDAFALTDHEVYAPSLEVIQAMTAFPSGMVCYPGEEASTRPGIHTSRYGSGVNHILAIGADRPVMATLCAAPDAYERQAKAIEETPPFDALPQLERGLAARLELTCRAIHDAGGIAVYCHPFWFKTSRFFAPPEETRFLLKHGTFDALEIGNFVPQRTATLNALVTELALEGIQPQPVVGTSDWHGPERWSPAHAYTLFLAQDASFDSFARAIRDRMTVATGGQFEDFAFGSYRLVKYAYFLMEHYFQPIHDPICKCQGDLISQSLADGIDRADEIARLRDDLACARRAFFGVER